MNVKLHIERLVLDGLDLNRAEAERVKEGLEGQLTRLINEGKLAPYLLTGGSYPSLKVNEIADLSSGPEVIGQQAAQHVYGSIGSVK